MGKASTPEELLARYGTSEHGNFTVIDTIGVPHTFMIGAKHVSYAAEHHHGRLGEETCKVIPCAHRGCTLKYREHETALLVECKVPIESQSGAGSELHNYLLASKAKAQADGRAGFAFVKAKGVEA
jgi:hypothetical protein